MCLNAHEVSRGVTDADTDMYRNRAWEPFMIRWKRRRQIKNSVACDIVYNKVKPRAHESAKRKHHVGFNLDKRGTCTNMPGERSGNVYEIGVL